MDHRTLLVAAFFAVGVAGLVDSSRAETISTDTGGIAVKESDVATPARGMTMDQVASKFGAPVTKVPAIGSPPISRWEYPGFVVYFEHEHVIHSVVASAGAPSSDAPSSDAPSTGAPPTGAPPADAPATDAPAAGAPAASADPAANS